jgi:predicted transcriptional regulator
MLKSLTNFIASDKPDAEDVLMCVLGLRRIEVKAYFELLKLGSADVKTVSKTLKRSRPTTQRVLQDLVLKGLATRKQIVIGKGGYRYEYQPIPVNKLTEKVETKLKDLSAKMIQSINELYQKIASNQVS